MVAQILDGKKIALECRAQIKERVARFFQEEGVAPGLAVILVGENPASEVYVRNKEIACKKAGITSFHHALPDTATQAELESLIDELNEDPKVHGILLQLPLPDQLSADELLRRIRPEKDADGFHPMSAGLLAVGQPSFVPCTPKGVIVLLERTGIELSGKDAIVVGRSNIVGKPVAHLLLQKNATVTIAHSRTTALDEKVRAADIVVAAVGRPQMIQGDWIKPGAVVIDVGINRLEDGSIVGDVEYEAAAERASHITPVPGGVGPMTVAMLLENTLEGAMAAHG